MSHSLSLELNGYSMRVLCENHFTERRQDRFAGHCACGWKGKTRGDWAEAAADMRRHYWYDAHPERST